jgi:hypothetical protein
MASLDVQRPSRPFLRVGAIIHAMSWRRGLILVALFVWAVTGPIGMAFDGCALMCDEPCALVTASISEPPTVPFISTVAGSVPDVSHGRPIRIASSLEPPPRPAPHSA